MPPTVVVRLQLLDMRQGPEVAELAAVPTDALVPERAAYTLRRFSGSGTSRLRVSHRGELVSALREGHAARAEFEPGQFSRDIGPDLRVTAARGSYELGPTNSAWPALEAPLHDHQDEALRASLLGLQRAIRWNGVPMYPTVVVWELTLRGDGVREPWLSLSTVLARCIPASSATELLTGYGDLVEKGAFTEGVLGRLAPWPRAYPQLGVALEDLYPLVMGPMKLCKPLATSLHCAVLEIQGSHGVSGLVRIPDALLSDPASRERAAAFLVVRSDATRKRPADVSAGEHAVGRSIYFTKTRLRVLMEQGAVGPAPEGFVFAPVIEERHWTVLGLSEETALLELWQVGTLDKFRRGVEGALSQAEGPDERSRVWTAYSHAFAQVFRNNDLLEYCRRLADRSCSSLW